MSLFEDTNPRALKDLLGEVHSRTMVLPDFQRDFVWEPGATQELIVSIANNYPAGSLLRVRDTQRILRGPRVRGGTQARWAETHVPRARRPAAVDFALSGLLRCRGASLLPRLKKLLDGADFEEAIFHIRATTKWVKAHEQFDLQAKELILPLSVLKGGAGGFLQWLLQVTNPLAQDERTRMLDALTGINDRWIKTIDNYHFPVVTLSDQTEADALCTIFETLNRTGVKLSVFELLTARFWPLDIKLRELWDKARKEYPVIDDFEVDPYYVLQAIALASRRAPSCKRSDVLNLTAADVRDWWENVRRGWRRGWRSCGTTAR